MGSRLLFAIALTAAAQTKPGLVEGVVTNALTGSPAPRVRVSLGADKKSYAATTAPDGKFSIGGIEPGPYIVTAERVGFLRFQDGLEVGAAGTAPAYKVELVPEASITGRVLDPDGQPVESATVAVSAGEKGQGRSTNDRGEFRVDNLEAGRYRLTVRPMRSVLPPEIRTDGTREENFDDAEYPGLLEVRAGAEVAGVEIRLRRAPIVRVSGVVLGVSGSPQVNAYRPHAPNSLVPAIIEGNRFSIWRLPPGKYRLWATAGRMSSATEPVEVGATDIDGIELRLVSPMELTGRIEWEGPPPEDGKAIRVELVPPPGQRGRVSAEVTPNGTFHAPNVPPERWEVLTTRSYVKALYQGQTEIRDGILDLSRGVAEPVLVRLSAAVGTVSGIVRDRKGPASGARVTLMPEGRPERVRHLTSASDGSYVFVDVPPGLYRLYVAEADATKVEVREKDRLTRDLELPR